MRFKNVFILIFLFTILISSLFSQAVEGFKRQTFLSFKVGKTPFVMEETIIDALTNERIDTSPVKSIIHLDQPGMDNIMSYTLALFSQKEKINIELSYFGGNGSPIRGFGGGVGFRPYKEVSPNFNIHAGGDLNLALFWGQIGEVGSRSGDLYLTAPDGNKYYTGSDVDVSAGSFGVSLYSGINILFSKSFGITSDFGYRFLSKIDKWKFEVTSDEKDEDDEQQSCELPADGFEQKPSGLKLSGFFFRIGFIASF